MLSEQEKRLITIIKKSIDSEKGNSNYVMNNDTSILCPEKRSPWQILIKNERKNNGRDLRNNGSGIIIEKK